MSLTIHSWFDEPFDMAGKHSHLGIIINPANSTIITVRPANQYVYQCLISLIILMLSVSFYLKALTPEQQVEAAQTMYLRRHQVRAEDTTPQPDALAVTALGTSNPPDEQVDAEVSLSSCP